MKKDLLLEEIAAKGDELETLRAIRAKVAATLDRTQSARDISALARQLQQVVTRIKVLEDVAGITDEEREMDALIASKRQVRRLRQPADDTDGATDEQ